MVVKIKGENDLGRMSMTKDDKLISDFIRKQYRPFDTHEQFERGFSAYQAGFVCNRMRLIATWLRFGIWAWRRQCVAKR